VESVLNYIQTFAVCATLGVLIWYTIETSGLRKEASKQNITNVRPCISIYTDPGLDSSGLFICKNVGFGPAFDIRINEFIYKGNRYKIDRIPSLEKSGQTNLYAATLLKDPHPEWGNWWEIGRASCRERVSIDV
jgi:hypothetical protein